MSNQLKCTRQNLLRKIDLSKKFKNNHHEWVVWWCAGIYKNNQDRSVPLTAVIFRRIENNILLDETIVSYIPVSWLGQVRLGTIWKDGRCNSQTVLESFNNVIVDFTSGRFTLNSFNESSSLAKEFRPYPSEIYPLTYPKDKSWILEFPIDTGGKLVIPCMEFFARCYGYSEEVNRILTTYPWGSGADSVVEKMTAPIDAPEDGRWIVNLKSSIPNDDAVLVAHLKYDLYAQSKAKEIYAQIESSYSATKAGAFIKVAPWFEGFAQLNVEGIWFNDRKSFLALRVNGMSDPDGADIERHRQNKNKSEASSGDFNANNSLKVISRGSKNFPEIVNLTSDDAPDRGSSIVEIHNDVRVKLGIARKIVGAKLIKTGNENSIVFTDSSPNQSELSTGEAHGSGKGVGQASIIAKSILESHGTLRDVWNAMLFLKRQHPLQITSVDWFTFEDGFKSLGDPNLISLLPSIENAKSYDKSALNWLNVRIGKRPPFFSTIGRKIIAQGLNAIFFKSCF